MTKGRRLLVAVVAFALALAVFALRVALWRPRSVSGPAPTDGFTRTSGVLHVHTRLSDGAGSPEDVASAARAAGLQYVVITDHNNLDAKAFEGYHDGVLVLVGTEVSTTAGHVLGVGTAAAPYRFSGDARDALDDIRDLGGVSFAAHPTSPRPDFRWTGGDLPGGWGLEVLNGDTEARRAGWPRLLRTAGLYPLNPRYALLAGLRPPDEALALWDARLAARPTAAVAGADAHARIPVRKNLALPVPSYRTLFSIARTHVLLDRPLTGDAAVDGRVLTAALAAGRAYVGLDALAPADGFFFVAEAEGRRWTMGETAPPLPALRFKAGGRVPEGTTLVLRQDGREIARTEGSLDVAAAGPGVYRVEAFVDGWDAPWVITNAIGVFDAAVQEARAANAAWPPEAPAPEAAAIIDGFDTPATTFHAEFDPSSSMEQPVVADREGQKGGAARLRFRLGAPAPGRPYTWCALASRQERDLSGRSGLVLALKGDGVYRVWVQVRDLNPASGDEGTEWWFASLKTTTQWRRVSVPFDRLRSINPRTDGRLDLDKVRQIVFVVDPGAMPPGAAGTIWLDDLAAY